MQWKQLNLEISEAGDIRLNGIAIPSHNSHHNGYAGIKLSVHRLVAIAFHGNQPVGEKFYVVDHIDGDTANNHKDNLRWVTQSENCRNHPEKISRKLTQKDIDCILLLKPESHESLSQMAKRMCVSLSCVSQIRSGYNWKQGKNHFNNKRILTPDQVAEIKAWAKPKPTAAEVAKKFKVSQQTIRDIWNSR